MKFKVEVDLGWVDDEDNIDNAVKRGIVNEITSKFSEKLKDGVFKSVESRIAEKVDNLIDEIMQNFMNREITITDKWGDVTDKFENVTELLKQKFDEFVSGKVDSDGEPIRKKGCSYGGEKNRIEHLIDKSISEKTNRFSDDILRNVDGRIKDQLQKSLKDKISDTLVKKISLDSVLD